MNWTLLKGGNWRGKSECATVRIDCYRGVGLWQWRAIGIGHSERIRRRTFDCNGFDSADQAKLFSEAIVKIME